MDTKSLIFGGLIGLIVIFIIVAVVLYLKQKKSSSSSSVPQNRNNASETDDSNDYSDDDDDNIITPTITTKTTTTNTYTTGSGRLVTVTTNPDGTKVYKYSSIGSSPSPTPTPSPTSNSKSSLSCSALYQVQPGDYLNLISQRFGVPVSDITTWNNISDPNVLNLNYLCLNAPGTTTPFTSSTCSAVHVVGNGDTIDSIASTYNVDPTWLGKWNNIQNINVINGGQLLCIPSLPPSSVIPSSIPSSFFQNLFG